MVSLFGRHCNPKATTKEEDDLNPSCIKTQEMRNLSLSVSFREFAMKDKKQQRNAW